MMAIRCEKAFGVKADTLCRIQTARDLVLAAAREHEKKIKVKPFRVAA